MKKILVILQQANMQDLQALESISAVMVLATFGHEVRILFKDAALSLLQQDMQFVADQMLFKLASNMVDSFEYYDLLPILIEQNNRGHYFVQKTQHELEFVELNAEFLQQFEQVMVF